MRATFLEAVEITDIPGYQQYKNGQTGTFLAGAVVHELNKGKEDCIHHYLLPMAKGSKTLGVCKKRGREKVHYNTPQVGGYVKRNKGDVIVEENGRLVAIDPKIDEEYY